VSAVFGPGPNGEPNDPRSKYRYLLHRDLLPPGEPMFPFPTRRLAVIMLNPSTADATTDDPTIRRCVDFGKRWAFSDLVVGNLFAYRATDPNELLALSLEEAVGPENDGCLGSMVSIADRVLCAWGTKGKWKGREAAVVRWIKDHSPWVLRLTKHGHPEHPLYMPAETKPFIWSQQPITEEQTS
jgi:hypothetical protein